MVTTENYLNDKNILVAPELAFTFPVQIGNTGISANADGKKIVKAGTPLYGTEDVLFNRQTVLLTSASAGSTVAGISLHDVDVTSGTKSATLVYSGFVDFLKLDSDVQTAITTALSAGGYEPTKGFRLTFIKGAK